MAEIEGFEPIKAQFIVISTPKEVSDITFFKLNAISECHLQKLYTTH